MGFHLFFRVDMGYFYVLLSILLLWHINAATYVYVETSYSFQFVLYARLSLFA